MGPQRVFIHADESCLGNQFKGRARPGGAGCLVETWEGEVWTPLDLWISEPDTTNNRMALRSALEPLGVLEPDRAVRFVSDSQYLVKGVNEWMPGWKARGWTRKAGPIENLELWKALDRALAGRVFEASWVRGHAGHARNEYANDLAVRAATEQSASGGLVESGFAAWLQQARARGKYLDFMEFQPPE